MTFESSFKAIDNTLHHDDGCSTALDYVEQSSWVLFLKYFDDLCITLIHQAIYMLHHLLETMQDRFVTEGGIKERMFQTRQNYRNNQNNPSSSKTQSTPIPPTNNNQQEDFQ